MRVPYPKRTMGSDDERPTVAPSARSWLTMAGLGALLGLILTALDAPLWAFYVSPVVMAPFLVSELRRTDAEESQVRPGDRV